MLRTRHALAGFAAILVAGSAPAQNVLVNGDFEVNPPSTLGNHIPYPIAPWVLGAGQTSNVVTVNGGTTYGHLGPWLDADPATGTGVLQHYLDIANGQNDFYQPFTPSCTDTVTFGGYFSTRADLAGTASIKIVQGVGAGGALVGTTNVTSLPAGNSMEDPWTLASYNTVLTGGVTYSFVVTMDNNMNFDEGFVRYRTRCDADMPHDSTHVSPYDSTRVNPYDSTRVHPYDSTRVHPYDSTRVHPQDSTRVRPCCPPWNAGQLESVMSYRGTGGIKGNFTLRFEAPATAAQNAALNSQLAAYLAYVHAVNPAVTQLQIEFRLFDAGTGNAPVTAGQIGPPLTLTWSPTMSGPTVFPPGLMQVNRWYTVRTRIGVTGPRGPQRFIPDDCAVVEMFVRLQVLP